MIPGPLVGSQGVFAAAVPIPDKYSPKSFRLLHILHIHAKKGGVRIWERCGGGGARRKKNNLKLE
jgi:hypothetical protein